MRCVIIPNVKIAVVETDKLIRDLIIDVLAFSVNREIFSFENDAEARHYIETPESADIILSEVDIPNSGGFELLTDLKQKYPKKIFIIMSHDSAYEEKAVELGADAFIAKPFSVNDLFDVVQKFVVEIDWKPYA